MNESCPEQLSLAAGSVLSGGNLAEPFWLSCFLSCDGQVTQTALPLCPSAGLPHCSRGQHASCKSHPLLEPLACPGMQDSPHREHLGFLVHRSVAGWQGEVKQGGHVGPLGKATWASRIL